MVEIADEVRRPSWGDALVLMAKLGVRRHVRLDDLSNRPGTGRRPIKSGTNDGKCPWTRQ